MACDHLQSLTLLYCHNVQEAHVGHFVTEVNTAMHRQQEHDKLAAVVNRIECYDAFDCNNDEAEKVGTLESIDVYQFVLII